MKKIICMALLLALVAVLALPMMASAATKDGTGTTIVGGSIVGVGVTVTAPSGLAFGTLVASTTVANNKTATAGSINVTAGSGTITGWTVTVAQLTGVATLGYLASGATSKLTDPLLVAKTSADPFFSVAAIGNNTPINGTTWTDTRLTYIGSAVGATPLPLYARQWVETADLSLTPGAFTLTLTFTGTVTY